MRFQRTSGALTFLAWMILTFAPAALLAQALTPVKPTGLQVVPNDFIGHWAFDDAIGATAVDRSSGNHPGALLNFPTDNSQWTSGKIGSGALSFDGFDDGVNVSNISNADGVSQLSAGAWVKLLGSGKIQTIISKNWYGSQEQWHLVTDASSRPQIMLRNAQDQIGIVTAPTPIDSTWHHLFFVYNGTQLNLYLDGVLVGTPVALTGVIKDLNAPVCIGNMAGGLNTCHTSSNVGFRGVIDDARLYQRALSAAEVKDIYCHGEPDAIFCGGTGINQAPVVSAGIAQTITLPASATLVGTATDDGKPVAATLAYQWSKVSGPGVVTFSAISSPTGTANFSLPGTYILKLSVSDTKLSTDSTVTIEVEPAPTGIRGDVNRDGVVNDLDRVKLASHLLESSLPPFFSVDADVDNSGVVDSYDLFRLERFLSTQAGHLPWDVRYPLRRFSFDSKGNPVGVGASETPEQLSAGYLGKLTELPSPGYPGGTWDNIEYKRKGLARLQGCPLPPLNLNFNTPKFSGDTTYNASLSYPYDRDSVSSARYDKFRLTSTCDIWLRDYTPGTVLPMVPLREYVTETIFRAFKIPTPEVIAFAEILEIIHPDTEPDFYDFKYFTFLQRNNEWKDQFPFLDQFDYDDPNDGSRDPEIKEFSDERFTGASDLKLEGDGFSWVRRSGTDVINGNFVDERLELDTTHSIRYFLLTGLVVTEDHAPFQNEDYVFSYAVNKWRTVPVDFDYSLLDGYDHIPWRVEAAIAKMPQDQRAALLSEYYNIAREIFDSPDNLNFILLKIDRFPLPADTQKIKAIIRARFLIYALYFSSPEFAQLAGKPYVPFQHQDEFIREALRFAEASHTNLPEIKEIIEKMYELVGKLVPTPLPKRAPRILIQPVDANWVSLGRAASFAVAATGELPLAYQWRKNGIAINGANSAKLEFQSLTQADTQGVYDCVISNSQGTITTSSVSFKFIPIPLISSHPQDQTVKLHQEANFSIDLQFTPPQQTTYQWKKNGRRIFDDGIHYVGTQTPTLKIVSTANADEGAYVCVVDYHLPELVTTLESQPGNLIVLEPAFAPIPNQKTVSNQLISIPLSIVNPVNVTDDFTMSAVSGDQSLVAQIKHWSLLL
jgi:Concanavalin A-like lectin/glucanases superfamily/Immunoglobulin domain/Dockerin type I domain